MIRTTIGIALLILIAIYGVMYIKRESFMSVSKLPLSASSASSASSIIVASNLPKVASASMFSGSIPTLNDSVRGAVREELLAAGLLKKPYIGRDAYPAGTSFAYDGGLQQKWQQNAACNARDWCCRCRRRRNRCNCEHF